MPEDPMTKVMDPYTVKLSLGADAVTRVLEVSARGAPVFLPTITQELSSGRHPVRVMTRGALGETGYGETHLKRSRWGSWI